MQKELLESGYGEPSDACPGCAVPCGMCETEIQYIAQSPQDYAAQTSRIAELERENVELRGMIKYCAEMLDTPNKGTVTAARALALKRSLENAL